MWSKPRQLLGLAAVAIAVALARAATAAAAAAAPLAAAAAAAAVAAADRARSLHKASHRPAITVPSLHRVSAHNPPGRRWQLKHTYA